MRKSIITTVALAGLGLMPSLAMASPASDAILANLRNAVGFVEIKYANFDMGTVYDAGLANGAYGTSSTSAAPAVAAGEAALNALPQSPALNTYIAGEDSWGIARITSIEDSLANNLFVSGESHGGVGYEMTAMFYGVKDYHLDKTTDQQVTNGTGMVLEIYLAPVTTDPFSAAAGGAGRTSVDDYTTVTDGELVLRMVSIGGHINIESADGGADAEFLSIFRPSENKGEGAAYLASVGGLWGDVFNSDVFDGTAGVLGFDPAYAANITAGLDYDPADGYLTFETFPNVTDTDWLVRSNDPLRLKITNAIPEPLTAATGMMALGALSLIATRRRKA